MEKNKNTNIQVNSYFLQVIFEKKMCIGMEKAFCFFKDFLYSAAGNLLRID